MKKFIFFLILAVAILQRAESAHAHATLIVSDPADGAVIHAVPNLVKLTFSEVVSPLVLRLLKPSGEIVQLSHFSQQQEMLQVDLPSDLGNGTSILSWRVASQDGHPVGGTLTFSIDTASRQVADEIDSKGVHFPIWFTTYINIVLLTLCVGGCIFYTWVSVPRKPIPRTFVYLSLFGIIAALGVLIVDIFDAVDWNNNDLWNFRLWAGSIGYTIGVPAALVVIAHIFVMIARQVSERKAKAISIFALVAGALAFTVSGHAGAAAPRILMRPAIFLHLVSVLFWAGSLIPLFVMVGRGHSPVDTLRRFSLPIAISLSILVVTGTILGIVELGKIDELWNSAYGIVLSLKLLALLFLFALAAVNRFYLTPRLSIEGNNSVRYLKYSIAGEIVIVAVVLGIVSLWRFTPPPNEMSAVTQLSTGIQFHAHGTRGMANLIVSPARPGPVGVTINVLDAESRPLAVKGVQISLVDVHNTLEPIRRKAHRVTSSTWKVDDLVIPTAGSWVVRVEMLISDFDQITIRTNVDIDK